MNWLYRISFSRRIQAALLIFLIIPLLILTGLSYVSNKQANEENVRTNMKGIVGILANDLSKTANDVTYTVNQYSAASNKDLFDNLKALKDIRWFEGFGHYMNYVDLNEMTTLQVGKLSLVHVNVFYVNRSYYPIIGSVNAQQVSVLRSDPRFDHLSEEDANSGLVRWFRAERDEGYGDMFGADYYLFLKKTVYDPFEQEILGTLFVGIPSSYFDGLFRNAGEGVFTLYDANGAILAGTADSPRSYTDEPRSGWMRETVSVKGTPWTLTYELERAAAIGGMTQRFLYTIMTVVIVFLVFLFISHTIAKGLNRPIQKLMRVASQYGEGNSLIRYQVRGKDEISRLGMSINTMLDNINALIQKVKDEQEEKRMIELKALYSQLQPHFLLNTLNSLKCNLAIEGDHANSQTIDALMAYLRAHLRVQEPVSLAEECKLLEQYISVMRMRNRLNIEFESEIPEPFRDALVPRLILQPLVENSIIHGFTRMSDTPGIRVIVQEAPGGMEIQVIDNGRGMTAERALLLNRMLADGVEQSGERGIGLHNVQRRLKLAFGEEAALRFAPGEPQGLTARLYIPTFQLTGEDRNHV